MVKPHSVYLGYRSEHMGNGRRVRITFSKRMSRGMMGEDRFHTRYRLLQYGASFRFVSYLARDRNYDWIVQILRVKRDLVVVRTINDTCTSKIRDKHASTEPKDDIIIYNHDETIIR